jgi:hypothetical protein
MEHAFFTQMTAYFFVIPTVSVENKIKRANAPEFSPYPYISQLVSFILAGKPEGKRPLGRSRR